LFLTEVVRAQPSDTSTATPAAASESQSDDFYRFTSASASGSAPSDAKVAGIQYLCDPSTDFKQLSFYPAMSRVFLKYNTTIPSSAPVERLFSAAGQIMLPRRNRLGDDTFEKL